MKKDIQQVECGKVVIDGKTFTFVKSEMDVDPSRVDMDLSLNDFDDYLNDIFNGPLEEV